MVAAARDGRRRRAPPGLRVPRRERGLRRGRHRPPGSAGSVPRRPPSGRWATRPQPAGSRRRSGSRSSPATTTPTSRTTRSWPPPTGSASRSWSSPRPAAVARGCGRSVAPEALPDAIAAARREAAAAFGDDRLILERLVVGARHVEIQVLFDQHGNGVSLGERDCSIQRRHQKILEESPSPAVDEALRARLGEASLTLARAVGYVGAGTCEFLLDGRGRSTFLEMNTRLQVEHPVTELVTGRDLVADQLDIAAGQPLRDEPRPAPTPGGHAVEVRLYAEDAEDGFLPATGRIEALRWPTGDGVRVDAGIELGSEIGGRFDPMLAKIIAWGPDRAGRARAARRRARPDGRARRRHEPALPALAGPPAGRPGGRCPDRRPDPDLAARRLGGRRRRSRPRPGRSAADALLGHRRRRPIRGPAAGVSTRRGPSGSKADGRTRLVDAARRDAAGEPDPDRARARRRHRPPRPGRPERRVPAGAAARRGRRGPGRRRPRGRGRDRSGRCRRPDAGCRPVGPRRGRRTRSRPATRSSPSRR